MSGWAAEPRLAGCAAGTEDKHEGEQPWAHALARGWPAGFYGKGRRGEEMRGKRVSRTPPSKPMDQNQESDGQLSVDSPPVGPPRITLLDKPDDPGCGEDIEAVEGSLDLIIRRQF